MRQAQMEQADSMLGDMQDQDIVLLWINFHLTLGHSKANEGKDQGHFALVLAQCWLAQSAIARSSRS